MTHIMARDNSVHRQHESTTNLLETLPLVLLAMAKGSGYRLVTISPALVALDRRWDSLTQW
jgi:hypothetical protein